MPVFERIDLLSNYCGLCPHDVQLLSDSFDSFHGMSVEKAGNYIENCIAGCDPPMGIATNAVVNGREYLIPMRVEEPSIVAAASRGFKMALLEGGIETRSLGNSLRGQLYLSNVPHSLDVQNHILDNNEKILAIANRDHSYTKATKIGIDLVDDGLLVYIVVDTDDVQGANVVNQMCEAVTPFLINLTGADIITGILSNYADDCVAEAVMKVPVSALARADIPGKAVASRFLRLADLGFRGEIYRATTNNKGIMNGIVAVGNAVGQDSRALEAGAHAYAAGSGAYRSLAEWKTDGNHLYGYLCMPCAVGTVRGATGLPYAGLGLKILGNPKATELQQIMVATGLANNFSAIQTLVTDGINRGHLALHNKRFR